MNGIASVVSCWPSSRWRRQFAQVRPRRTKAGEAEFMQALAAQYPEANRLRVVQDNLNTHTAGSL